jgi:hypothetical protein
MGSIFRIYNINEYVSIKHTHTIHKQHVPAVGNRTGAVLDQLVKGQDGFARSLGALQSDPDEVPIIHDPSSSVQGLLMAGDLQKCFTFEGCSIIPGFNTSRYWKSMKSRLSDDFVVLF